MSDPQFTNGPWWLDEETQMVRVDGLSDVDICDTRHHIQNGALERDNWKANGALIAAAPDLYAALQGLGDVLKQHDAVHPHALTRIEGLLAKARGES